MFLSNYTIKSGIAKKFGKIIGTCVNFLFNLPAETSSTILLSYIGGYPVGGSGVSELLKKRVINQKQAERMMNFCVCAGPAFILNFIGTEIIRNGKIASVLYISQIISGLIIGIFQGMLTRLKKEKNSNTKQPEPDTNSKNAFISSCNAATTSIITMCSLVILFSSLISTISSLNFEINYKNLPKNIFITLISCFLEITNASLQIAKLNSNFQIEILSFALGFSGLSVHMQISSQFEHFNYKKFIIFRIIHGIISAILTKIILLYSKINTTVFSNINYTPKTELSGTCITSGLIILLSFFFIFSVENQKIKIKSDYYKPKMNAKF